MLKGLEISVLKLSTINNSDFGRIDAEFFGREFIKLENKLKEKKHSKLIKISTITDGEHGSPDLDDNSGIVYFSGNNIKENFIDKEKVRYCTKKLHEKNLRSSVQRNTVLMSIVGSVGRASIVNFDILANTDRNVATIKNIDKGCNPFYLSIFLNSRFGKFQTQRFSTGNVQPLLNLLQVKSIIISIPNEKFQNEIELYKV